ncbi:hypothetical protein FJ987_24015 [Mesorhizobium sp. CU2]|uniref:hypothetical protein n=1 Tax=unclassified Mesorhizobium TaxID=325217 RepID=UPI00112EEBD9|nr:MULTISPECIES: hypothetical protein [unclassified Mesorhizobium]TPN75985.1 hypothetical protein FJ988_28720 [Mesorhizobium sp. CU3]TPO07652.1 hypothetical protein FJ987_24015 [Mesorhizobium sp. CU2]
MDRSSKLRNLKFAQGMLRELRQRTEADGEKLLTYLIDMAYLEASDRVRANWSQDGDVDEDTGQVQRRAAQG